MKVVLLAGGFGTRLSEETDLKPKPMTEIGGKPILWHIMKHYSHYGFNDFVILLGYKGYMIKEYFANFFLHRSNVTIDLSNNNIEYHDNKTEPWKVTLVDTGYRTMTGGRIKHAQDFIGNEPFMLTYGDGVADVDINALLEFHKSHNGIMTITSIQPEGKFGALNIDDSNAILKFQEKLKGDGGWINSGFFVCEPKIFDYIPDGDDTVLEQETLQRLAEEGELYAYKHHGYWKCMDTLRDKKILYDLWESNQAPWRIWA